MACARKTLSPPMRWIAPASMPASLTTTTQRLPLMTPMPAMTPPPGTDLSASSLSTSQPAIDDSSSHGAPASSSRARRSRGSSWPRLSNNGFDFAEAATARASRARSCSTRCSMAARCATKLSPEVRMREVNVGTAEIMNVIANCCRDASRLSSRKH